MTRAVDRMKGSTVDQAILESSSHGNLRRYWIQEVLISLGDPEIGEGCGEKVDEERKRERRDETRLRNEIDLGCEPV